MTGPTERLEEIYEELGEMSANSDERDYRSRNMELTVKSDLVNREGTDVAVIEGSLVMSASENPEDEDSWVTVPIRATVEHEDQLSAMNTLIYTLNSIPAEFGDVIFEEGFLDLLAELEEIESEVNDRDLTELEESFDAGPDGDNSDGTPGS